MHRCERKMVICAMVGCGNRSSRDKEKRFFRLPTVIDHQGELTLSISKQRQSLWLSRSRGKTLNQVGIVMSVFALITLCLGNLSSCMKKIMWTGLHH